MTSVNDYSGDMSVPRIDDATAEALLAGKPVAAELEPVAMVLQALRDVSAQPVPPTAELAARMAAGVFPADGEVEQAPQPAGHRYQRTRGLLRRLAPVESGRIRLAARFAAAGVALGGVGLGTAGFAGSLPEPAQVQFESVVESVTPYRFTEPTGEPDAPGSGPGQAPSDTHAPGEEGDPGRDRPERPTGPSTEKPADPPHGNDRPDPSGGKQPDPPTAPGDHPGPPEHPGPPDKPGPPDDPGQPDDPGAPAGDRGPGPGEPGAAQPGEDD